MSPTTAGGAIAFMGFLVVLSFLLWAKTRKKSKTAMRSGKVVDFVVKGELPKDDDAEG